MDSVAAVKYLCVQMIKYVLLIPPIVILRFGEIYWRREYIAYKHSYTHMRAFGHVDFDFLCTNVVIWYYQGFFYCWYALFLPWNLRVLIALLKHLLFDTYNHLLNSKDFYIKRLKANSLSDKYNHTTCMFCLNPLSGNIPQSILVCGHRYHSHCLNTWEHRSIKQIINPKCPLCKKSYTTYTKWEYPWVKYHTQNIQNEINDFKIECFRCIVCFFVGAPFWIYSFQLFNLY